MSDPFGGAFDPRMFANIPLFRELARVMSWTGGPVNWDLGRQTAEAVVAAEGGGGGSDVEDELVDAVRVVELWLDEVTELPGVNGPVRALSGREWAQQASSSEGLGAYLEPVAAGMAAAMSQHMPEELQGLLGQLGAPGGVNPLAQAMRSMGAMLYGVQAGMIAGHLAEQLLSTYDLGLPTLHPATIGTVGDSAKRFAQEHDIDGTELRYWLALRESAHRRQFAGVPWLRAHVAELIRSFAEAADHDPGRLMEAFGGMGLDPSALQDPEALSAALQRPGAFRIEPTPAQRAALDRLQALVAFTSAWADIVVRAAAAERLPSLPRIEEAMRRRRAEQGPGERFLTQLVGLDLRPSDLRAAQSFCEMVIAARGQAGLDRAWRDARYLPTSAELHEPSRWLVRLAGEELHAGEAEQLDELDVEIPDDLGGLDES